MRDVFAICSVRGEGEARRARLRGIEGARTPDGHRTDLVAIRLTTARAYAVSLGNAQRHGGAGGIQGLMFGEFVTSTPAD